MMASPLQSLACSVIPSETTGPYPGDGTNGPNVLIQSGIVRSDIRASFGSSGTSVAAGTPLTATLQLVNTNNSCTPLAGYAIYLWHCNASGQYSMYSAGVTAANFFAWRAGHGVGNLNKVSLVSDNVFSNDGSTAGGADNQLWYTASGPVVSGGTSASLVIYQNIGWNFNAGPVTNAQRVGAGTLSFSACDGAQLAYSFSDGSGRSGVIPLTRITPNVTCSTSSARPTNGDFGLPGNWFDASTSGQGFFRAGRHCERLLRTLRGRHAHIRVHGRHQRGAVGNDQFDARRRDAGGLYRVIALHAHNSSR